MLYLVSTPIGNLGDLTFRAVEILKKCDYILCEDTRHSRPLLKHFEIQTPLRSFHKFNETQALEEVSSDLKAGKNIALISDAGTPLFSDPGEELVAHCRKEGIAVTALPGACAAVTALTLSGFPSIPFQFVGFLPKKEKELSTFLLEILSYTGTTLAYETPHRIEKTLAKLSTLAPTRRLCVARELTKFYEECLWGTPEELCAHFKKTPPRGEMVFIISPCIETSSRSELSLQEHIAQLQEKFGLSPKEAIKIAAQERGVSKRDVYREHCKKD